MITVNLTMDEAHVVSDAISELAERNEPTLGLIDCKALRAASNKLTAAIGKAA
jgi:hypothetical protein